MLNICPSFKAAPLIRHSVLTIFSRLASVKIALPVLFAMASAKTESKNTCYPCVYRRYTTSFKPLSSKPSCLFVTSFKAPKPTLATSPIKRIRY